MSKQPHVNRKSAWAEMNPPTNLGRNKAKREARAKGLRHIGKAPRGGGFGDMPDSALVALARRAKAALLGEKP